jgi:hypothetical protein
MQAMIVANDRFKRTSITCASLCAAQISSSLVVFLDLHRSRVVLTSGYATSSSREEVHFSYNRSFSQSLIFLSTHSPPRSTEGLAQNATNFGRALHH